MRGLSVQSALRKGNPLQEILKFIEKNRIDLVVMCTCGGTGITRWLLGSATDHVVRGSQIPVVVVLAKWKVE